MSVNTYSTNKPANASNGVNVAYGPTFTQKKFPTEPAVFGMRRQHVVRFKYDDLPTATTDELVLALPAYSEITSVKLGVITAFAGGTSYDIGLQTRAGVEVDNDGLFNDLALASINAKGKWAVGNGALAPVGTVNTSDAGVAADPVTFSTSGVGANDAVVVVTATGTFTDGEAMLIIEYTPLMDDYTAS
jgi:hypothetical protein